jgi:hypothetical protein
MLQALVRAAQTEELTEGSDEEDRLKLLAYPFRGKS